MKSLKTTLFIVFVALSIVISSGVGIVIYTQYTAYIKDTYQGTLKQSSEWIAEHYPIFNDPESLIREGHEKSEVYGSLSVEMHNLAKLLNIENIVLLDNSASTYRFVFGVSPALEPLYVLEELFLASYDPGASGKIIDEMYRTQTFQITPAPYTDEYGTHISSFLPIVYGCRYFDA